RAGVDEVAGLQRPAGRQVLDDLAHVPDQLRQVALLLDRAVDLERDRAARELAGLFDRAQRSDRRGLVEGLADAPRPALLLGLVLQVASCHVQAHAVAPDARQRIAGLD